MRIFRAETWDLSISFFCSAPPRRVCCLFPPGWLQILSAWAGISLSLSLCAVCSSSVPLWWPSAPGSMLGRQNPKPEMSSQECWIEGKNDFLQHAGSTLASAASMGLAFSASEAHCWLVFSFLSTGSLKDFMIFFFYCFIAMWTTVCIGARSYFIPGAGLCIDVCWNSCSPISPACSYPSEWQPCSPARCQLSFLLYCSYLAESAFESAFSLIVQVVNQSINRINPSINHRKCC